MYCARCGKPTENDQTLCNECLTHLQRADQRTNTPPPYAYHNSAPMSIPLNTYPTGFGKALASTIMSGVAFLISYVCVLNSSLSLFYADIHWIWYVLTLGLSIPALIMGAMSISHFKRCSRSGGKKPIATLVLGINGLVCAIGAISMIALNILMSELFDYIDSSYYYYY